MSSLNQVPDPEVPAKARTRRYSAAYKAKILDEYESLDKAGKGSLLRREGLYTSRLTHRRKQRKDGALKELGRPRGRRPGDRRDQEIAGLKRKLERPKAELVKARRVIEIQGKLSALLEEMLGSGSAERSTER